MTAITNGLNIKYRPWKVYGTKDDKKVVWAEITEDAANAREETLKKDGWNDISIIAGKEIENEAA